VELAEQGLVGIIIAIIFAIIILHIIPLCNSFLQHVFYLNKIFQQAKICRLPFPTRPTATHLEALLTTMANTVMASKRTTITKQKRQPPRRGINTSMKAKST